MHIIDSKPHLYHNACCDHLRERARFLVSECSFYMKFGVISVIFEDFLLICVKSRDFLVKKFGFQKLLALNLHRFSWY